MSRAALIAALTTLVACGGGDPADTAAASTGATTGGVGGGGSAPQALVASLVPATEPGEAPALLLFTHPTPFTLTLKLGGAHFISVTPEIPVRREPQLAASANVPLDLRVGYCKTAISSTCIFVDPKTLEAPSLLEPGVFYRASADGDAADALDVVIEQAPVQVPFRALQGLRSSLLPNAPSARIDVRVEGMATPLSYAVPLAGSSGYQNVWDATQIESIEYHDGAGAIFASDEAIDFDDHIGFTLVVAPEADPAAIASVALEP